MPIEIHKAPPPVVDADTVAAFTTVPVCVIGDELNRTNVMHSALRPLGSPVPFAGLAITVECMAGDNSALHFALAELTPGKVIVADARGHVDTAVWGEIMHTSAKARGAVAVVIDGSMRDSSAIAASGLPAYARGICARGPHKGWGGSVNANIQCGGVAVSPGDLIVGDADGVIVVRSGQTEGLLARCRERQRRETETLRRVSAGELTVHVLGMPSHERIGR